MTHGHTEHFSALKRDNTKEPGSHYVGKISQEKKEKYSKILFLVG